jgi:FkbM family methyltransferase
MTRIRKLVARLVPNRIRLRYLQSKEVKALRAWTEEDAARLAFYQAFVKKGDLVFDIGANLGNRTKVFHRIGAKVVAVEPQPRCWKVLKAAYSNDSSVEVVRKAVGREAGEVSMHLSDVHFLSSLSEEWIGKVSSSGRFGSTCWNRTMRVPAVTLDMLIQNYGVPSFVKIDVEGHEYEVLKGLCRKVKALSFEFTPETFSAAHSCVTLLHDLGMREFNFVEGESTRLAFQKWEDQGEIVSLLKTHQDSASMFGDIYARCPGQS